MVDFQKMSTEIKDLISRARTTINENLGIEHEEETLNNINSNNVNKSRIKVEAATRQIRCPECKHIHVFLNQQEVSCCNSIWYKE